MGRAIVTPEPGIYRDVPATAYHKWPFLSASRLGHLMRSPAHLRAELDAPSESTEDQILGQLVHAVTLQPDAVDSMFAVIPKCDRRTTKGKAAYAEFEASCAGKQPVSADQYQLASTIAQAVWKCLAAGNLLKRGTDVEFSVVFDHPAGVRCKMRNDMLVPSLGAIVDLKTTRDAGLGAFERSIFEWGYHRQAAFYLDGQKAIGGAYDSFIFVAVEKKPPFAVAVYNLNEESIAVGRQEVEGLIRVYRRCVETDEWPGYPDQVQDIGLPAWAMRRAATTFMEAA